MQQEDIKNDNEEEQIEKRIRPNVEKPKEVKLSYDILGMIFEFLSINEQLKLRLVVQQFNSVIQAKLKQLLSINHYKGSFSDYQKFISQFECLRELALPSILSIEDQLIVNQLQKVKIDDSFLNENEESIYFQTFFEKFEPISLGLCKFRLLKHIPEQKLKQIKELDLLKVMTVKDKQFLYDLPFLVSFAGHFQEKDPFFQTPDFPNLPYLKMLKIRLEGPNILENQIANFESFINQIQNLEVLELHYYTYHSTQQKQTVFDMFLSLPKLRVLMALNSLKEIEKHQFKKIFDYIIIDNNSQLETQNLTDEVIQTLLGFSKIVDLTNCRFGEEQQQSVQNFIDSKRQQQVQSENIIKVSFEHEIIKPNYGSYPIVQKNDPIKTLWGTKYYNFN